MKWINCCFRIQRGPRVRWSQSTSNVTTVLSVWWHQKGKFILIGTLSSLECCFVSSSADRASARSPRPLPTHLVGCHKRCCWPLGCHRSFSLSSLSQLTHGTKVCCFSQFKFSFNFNFKGSFNGAVNIH